MKRQLTILLVLLILLMPTFAANDGTSAIDFETIELLLDYINSNYYKEVDSKQLGEALYKGMFDALDPHSVYFTAEEYKEFNVGIEGSFSGVGISISPKDGYIEVIAPIKGTPAETAGILPGDVIIAVDGVSIQGLPIDTVVGKIRGPQGTSVKLTIQRPGVDKAILFEVKRAVIELNTVSHREVDGIDIIEITSFDQQTASHLQTVLAEEVFQKGLIIDLRNNPGGLLDQVITSSDYFLPKGQRIVTIDYAKSTDYIYNALSDGLTVPMVVLINNGSASASEIFAAAMKDNKRATLVGTKSYGKGTVQGLYALPNGGAVKLTIAEYLTPSNVSIHGSGVTPDIIVENTTEASEVLNKMLPMRSLVSSLRGSRDIDTKGLQQRLNYLGYQLTVDGSFGPMTQAALKDFQTKQGVKATGVLDVATKVLVDDVVLKEAGKKTKDAQLEKALALLKQ